MAWFLLFWGSSRTVYCMICIITLLFLFSNFCVCVCVFLFPPLMGGAKLILIGLPIYLFCTDIVNLFTNPSPPKPRTHNHHQQLHHRQYYPLRSNQEPLKFPIQQVFEYAHINIHITHVCVCINTRFWSRWYIAYSYKYMCYIYAETNQ